jgi:aminomuconate-semialdehyde/2-hydroxymuconate-6-semialdehyde dehydrogenase
MKRIQNFINGEFVEAASGRLFDKRSPLDNQVIAQVQRGRPRRGGRRRGRRARRLDGEWGRMTVAERVELLYAVADEINRRFDDFLPPRWPTPASPQPGLATSTFPAARPTSRSSPTWSRTCPRVLRDGHPRRRSAINYAVRRPVGVVGVVCPWNLPLLLMTWKVGPALACGNTVVVKPSEETPAPPPCWASDEQVGVPKGVYNVVHGFGPAPPASS